MKKTFFVILAIVVLILIFFFIIFIPNNIMPSKIINNKGDIGNKSNIELNNATTFNDNTNEDKCYKSENFRCTKITSGELDPDQKIVCGCPPICRENEILTSSVINEKWPDGSQKAKYSCSKGMPA